MRSIAVAAALFLAVPASQATAATIPAPACREQGLALRASADGPAVVRVSVTNREGRACTVSRAPGVTFENLDGSALPVPKGATGRYRLGPGGTAYATVRTVADPMDPEARRVGALAVSADPAHRGRAFAAAELGTEDAIRVWEPVTSWWQPSATAGDRALGID
ncbi:DUF4232 domain-containing protein [Streptomyces sp. S.PB5]|uniref:DUF4232 domain-containing protein n=1 Tax=Streptomyces sp. S.PB5 TaxID=3020844 RepID=UPI0025B13460|nr:DUF4232 domain-containing protein [Streptomyces sp. S.PB5]MDN3024267.1 DUF4232 domain-containing protein [Streptomyces sp. S.PB5]